MENTQRQAGRQSGKGVSLEKVLQIASMKRDSHLWQYVGAAAGQAASQGRMASWPHALPSQLRRLVPAQRRQDRAMRGLPLAPTVRAVPSPGTAAGTAAGAAAGAAGLGLSLRASHRGAAGSASRLSLGLGACLELGISAVLGHGGAAKLLGLPGGPAPGAAGGTGAPHMASRAAAEGARGTQRGGLACARRDAVLARKGRSRVVGVAQRKAIARNGTALAAAAWHFASWPGRAPSIPPRRSGPSAALACTGTPPAGR